MKEIIPNFYWLLGQGFDSNVYLITTSEENILIDSGLGDFFGSKASVNTLKKDEQYMIWMMYVVPRGDEVSDIIVQLNQNGITRFTKDVSVSGSIRYRTWKSFSLNRAGEWEIKVFHDKEDGIEVLNQLLVTVVE